MTLPASGTAEAQGVPPIVLFVDDDQDTLDLYGGYFEESGLWVAAARDPDDALRAAAELHPNLIVADLGFGDEARGIDLVCALKADPQLQNTPIIVVSGRPAEDLNASAECGADVVLRKPIEPGTLLSRARGLLDHSRDLRSRSRESVERGRAQPAKSAELPARTAAAAEKIATQRRCPQCASLLEWSARGTIEGIEYDYYHWCRRGCGLFCFDYRADRWVKLA